MNLQDLMKACSEGDVDIVKTLLSQGVDPTQQDEAGCSPLMVAAGAGVGEIVDVLLLEGAPWNSLDKQGRCAGEYAMMHDHSEVANCILDAGVRSELILGTVERNLGRPPKDSSMVSSEQYLQQKLRFSPDNKKIIDETGEAVMMDWEKFLMEAHAEAVCSGRGHVLNVGFGLGLVDSAIQMRHPQSHTIIEAHPDVIQKMMDSGWGSKPGMKIVQGRWQDVISDLGPFDGVFFDTYGEYYPDMRDFHAELPRLLNPGGIYSFFNGLAPDNPFFHAVYCQIVELEMQALGLDTTFVPLPVDTKDKEIWAEVKNRYWWNDIYFLPVCQLSEAKAES